MDDASRGPSKLTPIVLIALLFVLVAQVARTMFPLMYLMGEDWDFTAVGLIALAVYAAPILALPVTALEGRSLLAAGTVAIIGTRLAIQFVHPIPTWLAMAGTALALLGATLAIAGLAGWVRGRALVLGIALGLALDTALRAPTRSWDLAWQAGVGVVLVTLVLAAATLVLLVAIARGPVVTPAPVPPIAGVSVFGPFLALQLLFVQNLGYVGSQAHVGFAAATLVVLAGDALGLCVLALAWEFPPPRGAVGAAALTAAILAWSVTSVEGVPVIVLVLVLQALVTGFLGLALVGRSRSTHPRRTVLAVTGASLSFVGLTLLWMIDIDTPLPFPREVVPFIAATALGIAALRSNGAIATDRRRGPALALAGAVAVIVVTIPAWLWLNRPADSVTTLAGDRVRIVQYNVRGAVNTEGQIDPDDVARAIASSDPDVVVLQEVARGWPIFGAGDLLARLEQRLGMPYRYEPAADGQFGNAILSRLPMTLVASGPLPEVSGKQARSFLMVRLDAGSGRSIVVVGTHLETDASSQVDALLAAWDGAMPAVIAGDMNMEPSDEGNVRRFTDVGLVDAEGATGDPCRTTSAQPTSDCDRPSWVFVTTDLAIVDFRIGTVAASDHLPVHVTVELATG